MPRRSSTLARAVLLPAALVVLATLAPAAASSHSPDEVAAGGGLHVGAEPGLVPATSGRCAGAFRVAGTRLCSHGGDRPEAIRRSDVVRLPSAVGPQATSAVSCDGDGTSGRRVQALYLYPAGSPNHLSTYLGDIRLYAARVEDAFLGSAAETGGIRRPRWLTDADCQLKVTAVQVSAGAPGNFSTSISDLQAQGYTRNDRKYLMWVDATTYCGIATFWSDESKTAGNWNNTLTGYARVDRGCWGGWAESHELMHNLGAVQDAAPHSTYHQGTFGHCSDEYDVMCYSDGAGVVMDIVCASGSHDSLFDCGHDDYFSTNPSGGNYLTTAWNTADSGWLVWTVVDVISPITRIRADATVTPGSVPVRITHSATLPQAGLERVGLAHRVGSGAWGGVATSDASTSVTGDLSAGQPHRFRARPEALGGPAGGWDTSAAATPVIRQEGHASITWAGGWSLASPAGALGGSVRRSAHAGATATFSTGASDVAMVSARGPDRGIAEVFVDGTKVATLDLYAPAPQARRVVFARHLTPGSHTIRLRVTGNRAAASSAARVDLDAILLLTP